MIARAGSLRHNIAGSSNSSECNATPGCHDICFADLAILDECEAAQQREAIDQSYILLTNSQVEVERYRPAVLGVSSAHQMSQFEKALKKVGINKYHHLRLEELYNNDNIIDVLR